MKNLVRGAALGAVTALAASTASVVGVAPAQAAPMDDPAGPSAAGWLVDALTNGLMFNPRSGGFNDYGLSIDAGLAIEAIGGNGAAVDRISAALASRVNNYTTGADFGSADVYAGASAKALVFAQTAGDDPASYGGVDLVARTADRVNAAAPIAGRLEDSGTDYANVVGQAFAVRGLTAAGSPAARSATDFLLEQQCASGFFRLSFTADKTAGNQGCVEGDTDSKPDPDATAQTVLQLTALKRKSSQVVSAIRGATEWLASQQKDNGSFGGSPPTSSPNSNTTGLAGWALGSQGYCVPAARASAWLKDRQVSARGGALGDDIGAIAYDRDAFDAGQADGITTATTDQWRRATAQAAPAVATSVVKGQCKEKLLVVAKKLRVNQGSMQKLVIRRLDSGEKVKVQISKRTIKGKANRFGAFKKRFRVNNKVVENLPKSRKVTVTVTGEFSDIRRGKGKFYLKR